MARIVESRLDHTKWYAPSDSKQLLVFSTVSTSELSSFSRSIRPSWAGERSHLRDKSDVRSNGRSYVSDLYKSSSRRSAKRAIIGNPHSHFAQRVGEHVRTALQHDPLYQRLLNLRDANAFTEVRQPTPVYQRPAAGGEATAEWRRALAAVARQFDLSPTIIVQLQGVEPIRLHRLSAIQHVSFSTSPLAPGDNVSYRVPSAAGAGVAARNPVGCVKDLFYALGEIFVGLIQYDFRHVAVPAGADAGAADAGAGDVAVARTIMCRLALRAGDYRLVPLRAIVRYELLEHEHRLPGDQEPHDDTVHCRFNLVRVSGVSALRRTLICHRQNLNYVLNEAVSEKRACSAAGLE